MIVSTSVQNNESLALKAVDVWKVFGTDCERYLSNASQPRDAQTLGRLGYITGVREASFEVREGEIFILMGLSGSGKSTLLRCLTGLYPLSCGEVMIANQSLASATSQQLRDIRRRKISMVFQNFGLLPHLTVLENIAFPLRMNGMPREQRLQEARRVLELVGLAGRESFYPHELSGGQQQRVGIARSLVTDPAIWFLDEPFSALDPLIRKEMQNEFIRLQSSLRKTIVFVTHDFDEAVRLGDRIAIMQHGEILQIGTAEDLVLRPANDYVKAFVQDIPREKVVSLRALLEPASADMDGEAPFSLEMKVGQAAQRLIEADRPIAVVDADGAVVGQVSRASYSKWLKK
ncbi:MULTISPECIES: glycine betaine/L-proline ABC transporter ATP-binding protein [unclassified Pseudomonas]|jgi:glycine betaine/proline transport system ATP-binding protein|uniref:quaternary amine ABC transporter ATP-binding protein n=1 Tax=Pseudomonas TaxID=286 RepID=UPI0003068565|nr:MULTISPECIES: ATP-binding cassette domain-containing protein [unclassified Pseudomonas]MBB1606985.1 ABC transporter ATP-binding protein [Pseudomonas sp. UMC76]MBB1637879.1 ABC transporter ATP-binding protein [Pseudomonas sp. UME83]WBG61903.1 ATP-binding cassette domain-containing protein [Pseudomonas citronellolis]GLU36537.1 ABC transporter ATP-binding protein [Pseudomonas sp. NBRC 100443]NTX88613.1 ATP-binding cassette domain-containing protein [Pseudomonas sp. UMA643]